MNSLRIKVSNSINTDFLFYTDWKTEKKKKRIFNRRITQLPIHLKLNVIKRYWIFHISLMIYENALRKDGCKYAYRASLYNRIINFFFKCKLA